MTQFEIYATIDELFEFCAEYTSKRIYDHKEPDNNIKLVEHFSIRDDDKTIFKSFLKSAAGEVFSALRSATKNLTDAFVFDNSAVIGTVPIGSVYFKIELDDSVNPTQLEDATQKAMNYYVLREWYIMKGFEQESIVPDKNYSYNLSIVKNYGQGGGTGGGATSQTDTGAAGDISTRPHITI